MPENTILLLLPAIIIPLLFLFIVISLISAVRIVPEYQRLVVFRLGRLIRATGPGMVLLMPMIDKGVKVDLREQSHTLTQVVSTGDLTRVSVEFGWRYKVVDPAKWVLGGQGDLTAAFREIVESTLRSTIGALTNEQLRFEREQIAEAIHARLQKTADERGVKITHTEIREITRA